MGYRLGLQARQNGIWTLNSMSQYRAVLLKYVQNVVCLAEISKAFLEKDVVYLAAFVARKLVFIAQH